MKRPIIGVKDKEAIGAESHRVDEAQHDNVYVQGYSDKRARIYEDIGRGVRPTEKLTHRLYWARDMRPNGRPDMSDVARKKGEGYRLVKPDELGSLGIMPDNYEVTADGKIRNGDVVLMVCDASTARRNQERGQSAIEEKTTLDATSSELHRAGAGIPRVGDDLEKDVFLTQSVSDQPTQ